MFTSQERKNTRHATQALFVLPSLLFRLLVLHVLVAIIMTTSGCLAVPDTRKIPTQTYYVDYPKPYFRNIVLTSSSSSESRKISTELSKLDNKIDVIELPDVFQRAFPKSDSQFGVRINDLLKPSILEHVKDTGIRFIVVLNKYEESAGDFDVVGLPPAVAYGTLHTTSRLTAGLVDLYKPNSIKYFQTKAHATSTGAAFIVLIETVPATLESTIAAMARQIVKEIRQTIIKGSVKLTVVAGNWELAEEYTELSKGYDLLELKHNNAIEELWKDVVMTDYAKSVIKQWKIHETVVKAAKQWDTYNTIGDTLEGLAYLCRAADMGNPYAQMRLGRIYFGLDDITHNRSKSYLWYMFATIANEQYGLYNEKPVQWRALTEVDYKKKSVLTNYQLLKVEELLPQWEPGQCERELVDKGLGNDQ